MTAKKPKKTKYDIATTLKPWKFKPILETQTFELYELANKGSEPLWKEATSTQGEFTPSLRRNFISLAHTGMRNSQNKIIDILSANTGVWTGSEILLQGVADSMAWQIIQNQLCYARRLYKGHPAIDLKHSNFESTVRTAQHIHNKDPNAFALISDLTTFVQVGDVLTVDAEGRLTLGEVKEGKKNHEIFEFLKFFMKSGCPRSLHYFVQEHGESAFKQLKRMARQTDRMGHIAEIFNDGVSEDPDSKKKIYIPSEARIISNWDEELNSILEQTDTKNYALEVVDECLYLGAYANEAMLGAGHCAFNMWFDSLGGTYDCPRVRLIDCMTHPLAPPIFSRLISDKHKFDILFGRKNICIGLNIPKFLEVLSRNGVNVREATNKEASKLDQQGFPPFRLGGKAYQIKLGEKETPLMDGVLLRILMHSERPIDTIMAVLSAPEPELELDTSRED
ncbi:hypothetical protein [Pseudomonas sp. Marseille-P9899]|uniref:hypothetical protein n=1 Tax=Pseudomonas sp. Marseille-P9899 TaxID=2730401 RepID=UPI00158C7475|nr:hypothetical protein [Pseudomonas sp. Marseille-P9899]